MSSAQVVLVLPFDRLESECVVQALHDGGIAATCKHPFDGADVGAVLALDPQTPALLAGMVGRSAPIVDVTSVDTAGEMAISHERLAAVIRQVHSVTEFIAELTRAAELAADARDAPAPLMGLTPREREIAVLVGQGLRNEEIAERLGISFHTTRTHVSNTFAKLGLPHRQALAALVRRSGLPPTNVPEHPGTV